MDTEDWILLFAGIFIGGITVYFFTKNPLNLKAQAPAVIAENAEVITWKDYKGNDRKITVHREVKG